MVTKNKKICPGCGDDLKYYDSVQRGVRTKGRVVKQVKLRRLRCVSCGSVHRELPECVCPYKQYESEVIFGVLDGIITTETLGYEDFPCEVTMTRWKTHNLQLLLWRTYIERSLTL